MGRECDNARERDSSWIRRGGGEEQVQLREGGGAEAVRRLLQLGGGGGGKNTWDETHIFHAQVRHESPNSDSKRGHGDAGRDRERLAREQCGVEPVVDRVRLPF